MRSLLDRYPSLYILMAIFPGGPGLAGTGMSLFWILLGLRTTEVVAKIPPTSHHQQTNTQHFTGRMPFLLSNQQQDRYL